MDDVRFACRAPRSSRRARALTMMPRTARSATARPDGPSRVRVSNFGTFSGAGDVQKTDRVWPSG